MALLFRTVWVGILVCVVGHRVAFAAGVVEQGRFYSEDGEFSVTFDRLYRPARESATARVTTVDFQFSPVATVHGLLSVRTIEWFKLDTVVPRDQYEATAQWIIEDHRAHRFHDQNFEVKNARRELSGNVPIYEFLALGLYQRSKYAWHGVVLFFGDRVALVSEIVSPVESIDMRKLEATPSWGFTRWALSLTREEKRNQQ